jgi:hypothetical protein
MQGYKNWCPAKKNASTMVETMSKSSVRYVHQMAMWFGNKFLFFFSRDCGMSVLIDATTITNIHY